MYRDCDRTQAKGKTEYLIMHGDEAVASVGKDGDCQIFNNRYMPYDLYLEENTKDDIEIRIQNLENFYHWCASRVLALDREYAKEILNSIGASQAVTDRDRAQIALSYHCLSLRDIYWTKLSGEPAEFKTLNLYQNHLETAFIDVSLRGKQMTIQNSHLIADNLGTQGCFPKAWIRKNGDFYLLKDGGRNAVEHELLASKISRCFCVNQVYYEADTYDEQKVTSSKIITSLEYSIVPMEAFEVFAINQETDSLEYVLNLDAHSYYMMNIVDYLVGNTDRHWGNWGVLVDNMTNYPVRLYDLMDFNKAFERYDTLEGANCLTTGKRNISQREAAVEAVMQNGLNQICSINEEWFEDAAIKEMFFQRLEILEKAQRYMNTEILQKLKKT